MSGTHQQVAVITGGCRGIGAGVGVAEVRTDDLSRSILRAVP
jgi:NAD(P)-dependent dehydrogenase (short-subunit alcohol dehydrogenase family)